MFIALFNVVFFVKYNSGSSFVCEHINTTHTHTLPDDDLFETSPKTLIQDMINSENSMYICDHISMFPSALSHIMLLFENNCGQSYKSAPYTNQIFASL